MSSGRQGVRGPAGVTALGNHYVGLPPPTDTVGQVLGEVVEVLETAEIDYVVMGGLVAAAVARPRITDDVDLFVSPEHAGDALAALADAGFDTEEHDPMWLYKAWKHGVLVDVIFRSSGDIYLDDEMLRRAVRAEIRGREAKLIAPEDLLVVKAVASAEHGPHHWYDALGIIARTQIDWDYLVWRGRQAGPRRVLSLLLYAESNDLAVPAEAVEKLFDIVHPRSPEHGEKA